MMCKRRRLAAYATGLLLATLTAASFANDYEQGLRFHQKGNYPQSLLLFRRAAEQGDARAQFSLSYMYATGQGASPDYVEAHAWAALAEANGYIDAKNFRLLIEKNLTPEQLARAQLRARELADAPRPKPVPGAAAVPPSVSASLEAWRAAWSRRDAAAYLAAYAPDFKLPEGVSRAQWESQRRDRLSRATRIEVRIENPRVEIAADGSASVRFTQYYVSNLVGESVAKMLVFGNYGGSWLIREETSTPFRK
jgi:TPR repeat protein